MKSFQNNGEISNTGLFVLMFLYIMGSIYTLPIGFDAGHDSWLSPVLGTFAGIGLNAVYAYLCRQYPHKSIIEIAHMLLGSWLGKTIGLMYVWYGLTLESYVLRNFTDFTNTALLPRTPTIVVGTVLIGIVAWTAWCGIEVICRCAFFLLPFALLSWVLATLLLVPNMEVENILPIMESGWTPVLEGAGQIATIQFGETMLFAMLIPFLNRTAPVIKTVTTAIAVSGVLIMITFLTDIFVLGEITSQQVFPSYTAVMYISIGDFFERIEPLFFVIWIFEEFLKLTVIHLTTALALSQTLGSRNYRFFLIPLSLLIIQLSLFIHPNQLDLIAFIKEIWMYYSIPFIILVPFSLLTAFLFKRIKSKKATA
ncbi:hypothetical protein SY83_19905 [Paenibacillus swuensis]|uniref:Uncharacterized protein n=1 Tax=Paenibacillus swuensis TaxID=1178515 RepID=A0A172TMA9_9BACL|nr:endospore germination permease [Paenibacillus swuensis]ANE48181.1 hypothetical protein SY83_19905 [Paenibacillus swuensis]